MRDLVAKDRGSQVRATETTTQAQTPLDLSFQSSTDRAAEQRLIRDNSTRAISSNPSHNTPIEPTPTATPLSSFETTEQALRKQLDRLSTHANNTRVFAQGARHNSEEMHHTIQSHEASWAKYNPWSHRFYEGSLIRAQQQSLGVTNRLMEAAHLHESVLQSSLEQAHAKLSESSAAYQEGQMLRQKADRALAEARDLARQNKEQETHEVAERASHLTIRSLELLRTAQEKQQEAILALPPAESMSYLPLNISTAYGQHLQENKRLLDAVGQELQRTEDTIRAARSAVIVAGATVATGGIATMGVVGTYGVVGGSLVVVGGGTATGTGIGVLASGAEQTRAVHDGLRSSKKAFSDGLKQVGSDLELSLVTSASTATGIGSASRLTPLMGKALGSGRTALVTSGAASAGAASVPATALQEFVDVGLQRRNFQANEFGTRLVTNALASSIGGGIGTAGSLLRTGNHTRDVLVTGGEMLTDGAASIGIEAARASINGEEFSGVDALITFGQSIQGSVIGEASNRLQHRAQAPRYVGPVKAEPHETVQDFTGLRNSRPHSRDADVERNLHNYHLGVEAQTIPLDAIGPNGKQVPQRFIGTQKDTPQGTIYYLKSSDYDQVYKAYHRDTASGIGTEAGAESSNDSFFIPGKGVIVTRLPDRKGVSTLNPDGTVKLTAEEKRYLDGLAQHEYQHARGLGEYQAYFEFYRKTDPHLHRTKEPQQPPALSPEQLNDKTFQHLLAIHENGKLTDDALVMSLNDMRATVGVEAFEGIAERAFSDPAREKRVLHALELLHTSHASTEMAAQPTFLKAQPRVEARRRTPFNQERVLQAQEVGLQNASMSDQKSRLDPLLRRPAVLHEVGDNSPIPLPPGTKMEIDTDRLAYTQVKASEDRRQIPLENGGSVTGSLVFRYHSRTQELTPELPGYRITLNTRTAQYELTDIPVVQAGHAPPSGSRVYVESHNGTHSLIYNNQRLSDYNAPEILVTTDGQVFTRQCITTTPKGKNIQAVANLSGNSVTPSLSEYLKDKWHVPYIPVGMDLTGR